MIFLKLIKDTCINYYQFILKTDNRHALIKVICGVIYYHLQLIISTYLYKLLYSKLFNKILIVDYKSNYKRLLDYKGILAKYNPYLEKIHVSIQSDITEFFKSNFNLKYVYLYNTEIIPCDTFSNCTNLRYIHFKYSNTKCISSYSFHKCTALKFLKLPNSLKTINEFAFSNCTNLECIYIPKTIDIIQTNAFYNCKKLKKIYFY